jgi:uncharacterized protein (TIGR02001 family)
VMSLIFGAALIGSAVTASAVEIAGNVTLATDYRFRGISQLTGNFSPAIQGGFDLSVDPGFYIGTWASNVNFSCQEFGTVEGCVRPGGSIETDVYGGFKGMIDEELGYDLGILYYGYPKDGDADLGYTEYYGSLSFKGAKVGLNYSDDYFASTGKFYYLYGDYGFDLMENVSLSFHYGYNSFDKEDFLGNSDEYSDWKVAVSTTQLGVTWGLAYVDTDLDDDQDCFGVEKLCAATAVFSISKSL